LLSALSVAPSSEASALAIKTLRAAISIPNIFDFQELASLPCVQQFQKEKDPAYDFLQVFLTGNLETYRTFTKSHPSWLADNRTSPTILTNIDIDESKAQRKIRLLTLATLSNTPSRTLPYSKIVSSLDIPEDDVEVWLIDIIRAGLVEGKLSQARQELLVHRSTYRTFGRSEWEDLEARLEDWKVALEGILASDQIAALKEQELQQAVAAAVTASPAVNGTSEVTV
jgi:translation initiation factor 3 subunit M